MSEQANRDLLYDELARYMERKGIVRPDDEEPYAYHEPRYELPKRDAPPPTSPNKLTDADREEVRAMYADGATIVEVHARFPSVTRTHLRNVAKGRKRKRFPCETCGRVTTAKADAPGPFFCPEHEPVKLCPCGRENLRHGSKQCARCARAMHIKEAQARQARLKAEERAA